MQASQRMNISRRISLIAIFPSLLLGSVASANDGVTRQSRAGREFRYVRKFPASTLRARSTRHAKNTIGIAWDNASSKTGHTLGIIGDHVFEARGGRAATLTPIHQFLSSPENAGKVIAAEYRIPQKAMPYYKEAIERIVTAQKQNNLPFFNFRGATYEFKPLKKEHGRWIKIPHHWDGKKPLFKAPFTTFNAKLIKTPDGTYLETPAGVSASGKATKPLRIKTTLLPSGNVRLHSQSCASFVIETLNSVAAAHPELKLPVFQQTAGVMRVKAVISSGNAAKNKIPEATVLYDFDKAPSNLEVAIRSLQPTAE